MMSDFEKFKEKKRHEADIMQRKLRRNGGDLFKRLFEHGANGRVGYFVMCVLIVIFGTGTVVLGNAAYYSIINTPYMMVVWPFGVALSFFLYINLVAICVVVLDKL